MILLDTNVVSELMRPAPARHVVAWIDLQSADSLYLPAIVEAELRTGVQIMPEGKRRALLAATLDAMIEQDFTGRVLPFDSAAAKAYADISAARRIAGQPIGEPDCQIAAIARTHGASVATRNVRDFDGCGLTVVNPWEPPA